jgi:hypothetical protein
MTFDSTERSALVRLADILIPAGEGRSSASEADVSSEGLDRMLAVRPDLAMGLKKILHAATGRDPAQVIAELQGNDPAGFGVLAEIVSGAYFLNDRVRAELSYDGQTARPIDPRPDHLEDGLLQSVIDRGPIYRATPGKERK